MSYNFTGIDIPMLPTNVSPVGVDMGSAIVLPPGGNVFFVRGNGTTVTSYDYDAPGLGERLLPSVAVAAGYAASGRGDVIIALEGHTESFAAANSLSGLKAGTKILCRGSGTRRPTFTWTAAASTVAVSVADVTFANARCLAAGPAGTTALSVATAFVVSAAGFNLLGCDIECGVDADQLCTDLITTTAAADDMVIAGNNIHGALLSTITSILTTTGATDRLKIINNRMRAAAGASGQLLDLSNAALLENDILGNHFENLTASSTYVIKPHATSTGYVDGNRYYTKATGTAPAVSGWSTFTTTYQHGDNRCVTTTGVSAIICPAVDS